MDFDLHFGRFFGPKIDVFEKFLLPDFELQLEVRSAKIVILPRENAVFYNRRSFSTPEKDHMKLGAILTHWANIAVV